MLLRTIFSPAFLIPVFTIEVAAQCYWRNGGEQPNDQYRPCAASNLNTVCCADWNYCLPNGLCVEKNNATVFWRESCTLRDWDSGGCQDLCSTVGDEQKDDVRVTPCDGTSNSTTWCCGETTDCCDDIGDAYRHTIDAIFQGAVTSSSASISSSTTHSTQSISQATSSSMSATSSPTSTNTPSNTSSSGLSTGAKAGIGVGAALGVIALVALGWFIGKRTHKKDINNPYVLGAVQPPPKYELRATQPGELAGDQLHPHELPERREG